MSAGLERQGHCADAHPPPHIVVILADDLGWADLGFHGSPIKTPHLDRLAGAGARLEQFYVQPLCSPTRAALMTGRYPMRHGLQVGVVRPWAQYGLPLEERTLPQALKEAGYVTAICGKWHLGHFQRAYLPTQRGFDHQYGHYNGALDYFTHLRDGGLDWHRDDRPLEEEGYTTHLIATEAARLVREHDVKKPLFLYVPFNAVHSPHQVPAEYTQPYAHLPQARRTYAGMVAAMDEAVGAIVDALDRKGMRSNTLFIFSSDNGGPAPGRITDNGPYRAGKDTLYEGGVRVAAFATWPGRVRSGVAIDEPIHVVDWYPTLLKLAGASLEQTLPLDGVDIWPTLAEGRATTRNDMLLNSAPRTGAIRIGSWKLVLNGRLALLDGEPVPAATANGTREQNGAAPAETVELFNLADDPSEKTNLAEQRPEKVRQLRERYDVLARQAAPPKSAPRANGFKSPQVW